MEEEVSGGGGTPTVPPRPKSPPEFPDLGGKRKHMAKLQHLEREIRFLQEELKTIEEFQPASRSCKEVAEFVVESSDPFMPLKKGKKGNGRRGFWSWLCGMACFNSSCGCCSCRSECGCHLKCPSCCVSCQSCFRSLLQCLSCSNSRCCCRRVSCCSLGLPSCCGGCGRRRCCFNCSSFRFCCGCRDLCCNPL